MIVAFRPDEAPLGVAEVEAAGHPRDLPLAVHQDAGQVVHRLRLGLGVVMLTLGLKYSNLVLLYGNLMKLGVFW